MLLETQEDPFSTWEQAERYLGAGTRTYSPFAAHLDISPLCHPQLGAETFVLPTFWVPYHRGEYLSGQDASDLNGLYRHDDAFLLPVHPDALTCRLHGGDDLPECKPGPPVEVVPSANARTVFVRRVDGRAVRPHFLKLHYPRRLSRFTRRLRRPTIGLELWASNELLQAGAAVLPEVGAGIFGWDPEHSWGFVVRDTCPAGQALEQCTVPLFALYGRDFRAPDDPTLLEQLVARAGEPPAEFLARRIIEPMVRLWGRTAGATGCALEPHGQNTLFASSADGQRTAVFYRDCAVYVDPAIRAGRGLGDDLPAINVISRDVPLPREQVFSLTYDSFMGHHTFAYLARLAEQSWGVSPAVLQGAARAALAGEGEAASYLPSTTFAYDSVLHPGERWALVDTGARPDWR